VEVPPASKIEIPLQVKPRKRIWVGKGREVPMQFVVGLHPPGVEWEPSEAKKVNAELVYPPLLGFMAGVPLGVRRALAIALPLVVLALLLGLLIARNTQANNDATNAANASKTQTAVASSAQSAQASAQQTALANAAAMQTARVASVAATQTALVAGGAGGAGGNGADGADGIAGAKFINDFQLVVPRTGDGASPLVPNFVWDVTSADQVNVNQTTRQLVIPRLETAKVVDYNLEAKGSNYVVTNTSSVLFVRPPSIQVLTGNPLTVTLGQTTTLSWQVKAGNAGLIDRVSVDLGAEGVGQVVESPTMTRRYILCASNQAGSSCQAVKIWVIEGGAGPSGQPSGPGTDANVCTPKVVDVVIQGANFNARNLTLGAGSTVRWTNRDAVPRGLASETGAGGALVNNPLAPSGTYQFTFSTPGQFDYQLAGDPTKSGIITVLPPCTTTPTVTRTPTITQSPTKPAGASVTPSRTATKPVVPTVTVTRTPSKAPAVTMTLTPTPQPTGYVPGEPILPGLCMGGTVGVLMQNTTFIPARLVIHAGTIVRWTNRDATAHTTTSNSNVWNSGNLAPGASFAYTFGAVGSFQYHCNIHPNMKAIIIVIAGCTPTPTSTLPPPPTATDTRPPRPPTDTPEPTNTYTRVPTNTRPPTNTRVPPSDTPVPTDTFTPVISPVVGCTITSLRAARSGSCPIILYWSSTGCLDTGRLQSFRNGQPALDDMSVGSQSPPNGYFDEGYFECLTCTIRYTLTLYDVTGAPTTRNTSVTNYTCFGLQGDNGCIESPGLEVDNGSSVGETCLVRPTGEGTLPTQTNSIYYIDTRNRTTR
jgi:plastocyanin